MAFHPLRSLTEVVEPPRDGEFFFEESMDERRADATGLSGHVRALIGTHPLVALVSAAAVATLVTALFLY